mmetsp:Transcript_18403/g.69616  ORF Transcript_18403/g.69616 Transcript_18403/m.69616 type:complete len:250 (+) Transcript_18403:1193-1942(+)
MLRSRAPVSVLHSREIHSGFALKVLPRRKAPARPILPFTVKERASNRVHLMSKVDCSSSLGLTNRSWLSQLPFRVRKGASASLLCCSYSAAVKGRRESTIASSSWSSAKRGPSLGSSGAAAICPARNMEGRSPAQAQIKMKQTTSVSRTQPAYAAPMMRLAASRSNSTCAHCTSMMAKMLKKEKYTLKSSNVMYGSLGMASAKANFSAMAASRRPILKLSRSASSSAGMPKVGSAKTSMKVVMLSTLSE